MKTLDEVIKAIEICWEQDTCSRECPYMMAEPSCGLRRELDALHYLREYQNCGDCAYADTYLRCAKDSHNDPLDWETLKTMEGKPVWVECAGSFWAVIVCVEENRFWYRCRWADHDYCDREYMGEHWRAYRKERE